MNTVRSVQLCSADHTPFPYFKHNTTYYVAVPHNAVSKLIVQWNAACRVCITSEGQEVVCHPAANGHACINLHPELKAPRVRTPIPDFLTNFFGGNIIRQQRLYAFKVEIQADKPGYPVMASYDVHVLCPDDYEAAHAYSLELQRSPHAIAPDLISERVEGKRCPTCNQIRKVMEKL